jgi:hypothetical protein
MPTLPTIYTARSDVDGTHLARVERWYAERHAPDLVRAGFHTAQVYYWEVGTPLICNLYEIPGPELFGTEAYRNVAAHDPDGPAVIALLSSRSNTIYDQVLTGGGADGAGRRGAGAVTGWVRAPFLSTVRFDAPAADDGALLRWYESTEFPRLSTRPGFRAGRLCRRGPPHPTALSHDARWLAIHEWSELAAAMADGSPAEVAARHQAALAGRVTRLAYNVGRRHFRLTCGSVPVAP